MQGSGGCLAPEESEWTDLPPSLGWWDAEVVHQCRTVFQQFGRRDERCSAKHESLNIVPKILSWLCQLPSFFFSVPLVPLTL